MHPKKYLTTLLIAIGLTALIVSTESAFPSLQLINLKGRDLYFQIRHAFSHASEESDKILIVAIDDESLKRLEQRWPFPRSIYVEALARLRPFSPKVIGFDLIFSGKDPLAENDAEFSAALKTDNVVIAAYQDSVGEAGSRSMIGDHSGQIGIVDKPRDLDRTVRRTALYFSLSGTIFPSWETALFNRAFDKSLSSDLSQNMVIDYRLKAEDISTVSLWRLLEGSVLANELRNKIILIGPTAEVFHDIHATPLGSMPGVVMNANALTMLARGYLFSFPQKYLLILIYLFSIWFALLTGLARTFRKGFWSTCLLIGLYLGVGYWAFLSYKLVDLWLLSIFMFAAFLAAVSYRSARTWSLSRRLEREATPDQLTGFQTERFLRLKLMLELNQIGRKKDQDLILLFIRADRSGSTERDRFLLDASQRLRLSMRKSELVCRYGEDFFVILIAGSNLEDAGRFAEKIKKAGPFQVAAISMLQTKTSEVKTLLETGTRALSR